jgi:hypothetical protein
MPPDAAGNSQMSKTDARTRALNQFFAGGRRGGQAIEVVAKERAATDAKTARLRALRLEKEETDRLAKIEFDAADPPRPPRARRGKPA